jgi:streptomycin 6-kinase
VELKIPMRLAANCRKAPARAAWLDRLPDVVRELESRWSLTFGCPFDGESSCALVVPATRADRTSAVLKLGMPHMEGEHELQGLRFWDGDPTVRLLEADDNLGAMLLERCEPGTLRALPESEQDVVIAELLRRLWRAPSEPHPFRPLSVMTEYWSEETLADAERWPDTGLVREGLCLLKELPRTAPIQDVLLATDLHAGNVLASKRESWILIDPKPFIGDPSYDATQHLFNCQARLLYDPHGTIRRMADLLGVDYERVRLWMFARAVAEPRDDGTGDEVDAYRFTLARAIAP